MAAAVPLCSAASPGGARRCAPGAWEFVLQSSDVSWRQRSAGNGGFSEAEHLPAPLAQILPGTEQDNGSFLEAVLLKKPSNPWWFAFTALTSVAEDFSLSGSDCSRGIFSIDVGKNGCKAEMKAENLKI